MRLEAQKQTVKALDWKKNTKPTPTQAQREVSKTHRYTHTAPWFGCREDKEGEGARERGLALHRPPALPAPRLVLQLHSE